MRVCASVMGRNVEREKEGREFHGRIRRYGANGRLVMFLSGGNGRSTCIVLEDHYERLCYGGGQEGR